MKKRDFNILKKTISPQNALAMSELITIQEIKFLIGYIGAPMITMRNNLIKDFYYKNEPIVEIPVEDNNDYSNTKNGLTVFIPLALFNCC